MFLENRISTSSVGTVPRDGSAPYTLLTLHSQFGMPIDDINTIPHLFGPCFREPPVPLLDRYSLLTVVFLISYCCYPLFSFSREAYLAPVGQCRLLSYYSWKMGSWGVRQHGMQIDNILYLFHSSCIVDITRRPTIHHRCPLQSRKSGKSYIQIFRGPLLP